MANKTVIVTGALAYDQILNMPGSFSDYILPDKIHQINVSFVTDTYHRRLGGTGGNQAYSLSLLDVSVLLVASAGQDFADYRTFLKSTRINLRFIKQVKSLPTASGFAITDKKDNQIWGFSKGAMQKAKNLPLGPALRFVKSSKKEPLVVIAPNEVSAMSRYIHECVEGAIPYVFDPAFYIPSLPLTALKKGVKHAAILFGNDYEIALLRKRLGVRKEAPFSDTQIVVTTLGEKGSIVRHGKKRTKVKASAVRKVVDPTGAGDAYRAGFIAGYIAGEEPEKCAKMGSVAAAYAVEHYGTMEHSYTLRSFWKRFRENYHTSS